MTTIAIFGAAGSMGTRLSNTMRDKAQYRLLFVESGDAGMARLAQRGDQATNAKDALAHADVVVFAVPDRVLGAVAADVVPQAKPGTMIVCLDPAAPRAGLLPKRSDVTYFVTHPAHPPVFNDETDPEARRDFFGSGKAKQAIVCALMQGPEEDYFKGEAIARDLFGPILRAHRITVEQMAILEPALSETVTATCMMVIREAMDEAIARGVPADAARDFLLGHIHIDLAIFFDEIDWELSDGAKFAIEEAKKAIFQPDWKKVFEPDAIRRSVARITGQE